MRQQCRSVGVVVMMAKKTKRKQQASKHGAEISLQLDKEFVGSVVLSIN
jgi:hypothetical protein